MERTVLHINIADFSVAVERLLDNSLQGKALIIAESSPRAVVHDMSDEAYGDGVRKGMLLSRARHRCCKALVLPPRPQQYRRALSRCLEHALQYTPLAEGSRGNGHLYLDVTGTHRLFGPPPDIGWRLRNTLRRDLGFDPIWSVAPNKMVAKVASRLVKPRGEYIVAGGEEAQFLAPLPLHLLPGIPTVDMNRLRQVNIHKICQAVSLSAQELSVLCGHRAHFLYQAVRGIDSSPVHPVTIPGQEYTQQHTFTPDTNQETAVRAALATLMQQAGHGLRRRHLGCRQISVHLFYTDGVSVSRQAVAQEPVDDDPALEHLACTALYRAWHRRVRLRHISLACSRLQRPVQQLSLLQAINAGQRKNSRLSAACDAIRDRHGAGILFRGLQATAALHQQP